MSSICASKSDLSTAEQRKAEIDVTGTGLEISSGARAGKTKDFVLGGVGHLVTMEAISSRASAATLWVGADLKR